MVKTSLARVVQNLIDRDPSIQDALRRGYGNYSAIARLLKPMVEEELGREVTLEGLITSVKRASVTYKPSREYLRIVAGSILNMRTDVAKFSVEKTRRNIEMVRGVIANYPEAFLQVLEGTRTLTLIFDQRIMGELRLMFREADILDEKRNLAALIVESPREIVDTPGCIAAFYNPISRAGINIEETVSCFNETIIVLRMEDAGRAFTILTDVIREARRLLAGSSRRPA